MCLAASQRSSHVVEIVLLRPHLLRTAVSNILHLILDLLLRILSKSVNHDQLSSGVFGRSLLTILRQTGQPLPSWIIYAMQRIRRSAAEAIGIFRKSGVRSRIQQLRDQIDTDPGIE